MWTSSRVFSPHACCALACCAVSCSVTKLPPGTVVVKDDTIYVPKRENNVIKMLAKAIPGASSFS